MLIDQKHVLYDLTFYQKQSRDNIHCKLLQNTFFISTDKPYYRNVHVYQKVLRIPAHAKHVTAIFE